MQMTAAHAMMSLPKSVPRPSLPADSTLPQLRPLGFSHKGKFPSSLERTQASVTSVQFVRPDVPPTDEAPVRQTAALTSRSQPRLHGRSALEQARPCCQGRARKQCSCLVCSCDGPGPRWRSSLE